MAFPLQLIRENRSLSANQALGGKQQYGTTLWQPWFPMPSTESSTNLSFSFIQDVKGTNSPDENTSRIAAML